MPRVTNKVTKAELKCSSARNRANFSFRSLLSCSGGLEQSDGVSGPMRPMNAPRSGRSARLTTAPALRGALPDHSAPEQSVSDADGSRCSSQSVGSLWAWALLGGACAKSHSDQIAEREPLSLCSGESLGSRAFQWVCVDVELVYMPPAGRPTPLHNTRVKDDGKISLFRPGSSQRLSQRSHISVCRSELTFQYVVSGLTFSQRSVCSSRSPRVGHGGQVVAARGHGGQSCELPARPIE